MSWLATVSRNGQSPSTVPRSGALVGGFVVLALVYLDDTIRTPDHVRQYLELPVLGMVPRPRHGLRPLKHPASRPAETEPKPSTEMEVPTTAARV